MIIVYTEAGSLVWWDDCGFGTRDIPVKVVSSSIYLRDLLESCLHICRIQKNADAYFTSLFQENKRCFDAVHNHRTFFAVSYILSFSDSGIFDFDIICLSIFFLMRTFTVYPLVCSVTQSCLTLFKPMDYSLPGSSDHGIFQARIVKWVAISSSRGASQTRDRTCVSCVGRQIIFHGATWEASFALLANCKDAMQY